jgi:hypothetical protein
MDLTRRVEEHGGSPAELSPAALALLVLAGGHIAEKGVRVGMARSDYARAVAAFREQQPCQAAAEIAFAEILAPG